MRRNPVHQTWSIPPDIVTGQVSSNKRLSLRLVTENVDPKYVLVLETSGQMEDSDHWTWIRKAAHKFIRQDLPVNSYLSVSASNVSVEHGLVQGDRDSVRTVLADTIPGRYHLDTEHAVSQIAGQHQGLDLIFVTVNRPVRNHKQRQILDLANKFNMWISGYPILWFQ